MSIMPLRRPIRMLALALACLAYLPALAAGKSVDDYVHGTAAKYIQGRLQEAGVEVEEGLRLYPNDARLKAMASQLKNMKDQQKKDQGGQSSQGGDQNQDKQDKQDSSGQGGQNGKKDPRDKKNEKDKQDEKQDKDKDKDQNGKDKDKGGQDRKDQPPQPEPGKSGDSSGQAPAPAKPGQMSKDEAERLLNSYQDDEKREQKQMQKRGRQPVEVEEDW